ncbi:hypothetical protein AAG906_021754 [Vitis piasezkii]
MSGNIRECSFVDIIINIQYWVIDSITIPSLFIMGIPLITDHFDLLEQLDEFSRSFRRH